MMLPNIQGEFRAVADPDLRFAPSGVAVGKLRAVASKQKKNDAGEWVDDKEAWVNVIAFRQLAENMAESIQKGDLVVVIGRLNTENWEDKDGNKRTSVDIVADFIGPSVKFATAKVTRTERGSTRTEAALANSQDPWATPAGAQDEEPPF